MSAASSLTVVAGVPHIGQQKFGVLNTKMLSNTCVLYSSTHLRQKLQLVSHKNHCFVQQQALDALVKDVFGCVLIHSRQWVVQQQQLRIVVGCTSQADTLALTT